MPDRAHSSGTKRQPWLLAAGIVGLGLLGWGDHASAQSSEAPSEGRTEKEAQPEDAPQRGLPELDTSCERVDLFGGTDIERAGYCALRKEKFIDVRTLGMRAVEKDPQSFRAHFLLGAAQHLGEGNLPKALHLLQIAELQFTRRHGKRLAEDDPMRLAGYRVLFQLMDVYGEMDQHEERIRYARAITERLDIDYRAGTAWPLMKLGRFEEARAVVAEALESEDRWNRSVALTSRCAIESELRNREAAYEACREAGERAKTRRRGGAVELTNAGAAAEEFFQFEEAEQRYLAAAERGAEASVNPWGRLVHLYLGQGRFSEALSAWRQMRSYRASRPHRYLDQQDEAEAKLVGVALMLVAGRADLAEPMVEAIVERPDRQGTSSANAEQNEGGAAVVARVVRRMRARQLEAEATRAGLWERIELNAKAAGLRWDAWFASRSALEVLADPVRLVTTLRPEVPGSLEMPGWLDGEVVSVVGPGVADVALEQARAEEVLPAEQTDPVFAAYEAEVAWHRGDWRRCLSRGRRALEGAPRSLTLIATRGAALAADAARRLGRLDEALALYRSVLERDPGALERLELPLPVRFEASGELARSAVESLRSSPYFLEVAWGFRLALDDGGARLRDGSGSELVDVRTDEILGAPPKEAAEPLRRLARAVERGVFRPRLDFTQVDVRSLDGGLGRGVSAAQMLEIMGAEGP